MTWVTTAPVRLRNHWQNTVSRARGNRALADDAFNIIEKLYGEPHRHYHNLDHIAWCLDLLHEFIPSGPPGDPVWFERVELALFFHDIIYDPKRKDNEARSADVFRGFSTFLDLERVRVLEAYNDILATTHPASNAEVEHHPATQWVLDLDLASLGFAPEKFDENSAQIRQEYAWVPDDAFKAGRKTMLQGFLDRPKIYLTEECRNRFEAQARANLQRAIEKLG